MHPSFPRLVLGMKVKQLRLRASLSLRELSERTELSVSYLNEIEKGKKFPKPEKIAVLAEALHSTYDALVSTKLGEELNPLGEILDSALIQRFPLDLFGITVQDIVQLLSQAPREAGALARAIVDITRNYDMRIENLFHAALRSYQELNLNTFDDLELEAKSFRKRAGDLQTWQACATALESMSGADIRDFTATMREDFGNLRSIWIPGKRPVLYLNPSLLDNQKAFVIAREIGYRHLEIKDRAWASPPMEVHAFEQVLNDFNASYFAGALLIDRDEVLAQMTEFLGRSQWDGRAFLSMMRRFRATPEMFFYRLSQVLPKGLDLKRIHFLRFTGSPTTGYQLTKELNMSRVDIPKGIGLNEHFCRRWLSIRIFNQMRTDGVSEIADIQISRFFDTSPRFLCISVARPLVLQPGVLSSVTMGFHLDDEVESRIGFASDPRVETRELGQTCERCPLDTDQCQQRVAPPELYTRRQGRREQRKKVSEFIASHRR